MSKQVTTQEAEAILGTKFKGKVCRFDYPGYTPVYGMVDEIAIEVLPQREILVVIQMNDKRYTCSVDSIYQCLTLSKREREPGPYRKAEYPLSPKDAFKPENDGSIS